MKTSINNLSIKYVKEGNGDNTVLILPGWGTTIETYRVLINSISQYSCVYCLDMPGFGESEEPKESWDTDCFISFVTEFIKKQNIKQLDLIGHSNGGRIILKLMSEKDLDFKVNKIVLLGSAGIVHKQKLSLKLKVKFFKLGKKFLGLKLIKKMFPDALEHFKNKHGSADYKSASPIMRQTLVKCINEDMREYMPNIKAPTLMIWGELDTATPIQDAEIMEKLIPDAGLVRIKNGSHYAFLEQPEYVNTIIKTFLNGDK